MRVRTCSIGGLEREACADRPTHRFAGGQRKGDKGTFVQPTVILNPDVKSKVYTDEIFGPVISVKTFKTEEEALDMANDTTYGLGCTPSSIPSPHNFPLLICGCSDGIHQRHRPSPSSGRQARSRHSRHQLRLQHSDPNAVWRFQAERYREGEWEGGAE